MTKKHKAYVERLVHYSCDACEQWWSIGDGPTKGKLLCPRCGVAGKLAKNSKCPEKAAKAAKPEANDQYIHVLTGRKVEFIEVVNVKDDGGGYYKAVLYQYCSLPGLKRYCMRCDDFYHAFNILR